MFAYLVDNDGNILDGYIGQNPPQGWFQSETALSPKTSKVIGGKVIEIHSESNISIPVSPYIPPSLDELKVSKWAEIKMTRDAAEQGGFTYMNKTIDSDEKSCIRITAAVNAAQVGGDTFSLDWTCADNSVLTLTAAQAIGMGVAIALWSNTCHARARKIKEKIDAASSGGDLDAIFWSMDLTDPVSAPAT